MTERQTVVGGTDSRSNPPSPLKSAATIPDGNAPDVSVTPNTASPMFAGRSGNDANLPLCETERTGGLVERITITHFAKINKLANEPRNPGRLKNPWLPSRIRLRPKCRQETIATCFGDVEVAGVCSGCSY